MTEHGFISDIPFEFEMTFYEDNPRIDCKVKFDFNGQKIGLLSEDLRDGHSPFVHEEKLRFKFYPAMDTTATGIRDLPFAISETGNKYIEGNYWTALSDGTSGVAFFNKGNMGSIREKDNSFSIPLAYAMYYIWGTRMLYGPFNYEFALLPFSGNWRNADIHRKALEYSFPIPESETKPGKGFMDDRINTFSFAADDDIILTGLYPSGENVVARFYKSDDHNQVSALHFIRKSAEMTEITLDGKYLRNSDGNINFTPWEIKTFRINTK
jgi:alpha-mannosidase